MSIVAFVLGGALTGLVGAMVVPLAGVSWDSGVTVGLVGFIAAAIADFEHPGRAVLAGLGLGVVETVAAGEISSDYREVVVYGVLLVYLLGRDLTGDDGLIKRLRMARATAREDLVREVARPRSRQQGGQLVPAADVAGAGRRPLHAAVERGRPSRRAGR